ncbi:acyl-CoA dehydrogenase [Caulobacter sp. S45]|uniref:acyl-CoA dehydrogenase n=1 Tax=Caulobacter sp. S45 TaxID=1641861 RepID=UPI00131CE456|nr:acyl-CoA dehydrogenase [Caulobacter sp. S45]
MFQTLRRDLLTRHIYQWAKGVMPALSPTEREAIEAGDVWWDAELFTGNPDFQKLLDTPQARLSAEEQAFIDGPVEQLCAMLDDWKITWELGDLAPEAWAFLKENRFFGMIIPKAYGGLGFTNYGHAEVVKKISTRSVVGAVTAMVPNSLGPGELMMRFGTDAQRDYWLPRLADGREIPAFGLTSPEAGSDAANMIDTGVVCWGEWKGERTLGMKLNWHKRYITLGPVCTVLGLAFKLHDPDHLLGERTDLGITCALIPTDTAGVEIGRRHLPAMQMFQNGPNFGRDVFVPLENIIGGPERAGQGWKMLMTALAAGRGISLPAQSGAAAAFAALTTGAYARVRQQFGVSIGKFEGIQERLARLAANAYVVDAARRLTCAGLDQGHHPSVISSLMKLHATEIMRVSANDAMDVHGGKAIIDGPNNYLGALYRSVPVGITVEGANILTRSLMVFGQGAIRAHPYMLKEILALGDANRARGLDQFDEVFWTHVGHTLRTILRATSRSWTAGMFVPTPDAGAARRHYRALGRYAAAFALTSDIALLTLGGALKFKELLSARLGDILSEMYFMSAALKRWEDEGRQAEDLPLLDYVVKAGSARIEATFDEVFANLPSAIAGWLLRFAILPLGSNTRGPSDYLVHKCADILLEPGATRDRLVEGVYVGGADTAVAKLLEAFKLTVETQPIHDRLRKVRIKDWKIGRAQGLVNDEEAVRLEIADRAIAEVIEVDDFAPEELINRAARNAPARAKAAKAKPAPAQHPEAAE